MRFFKHLLVNCRGAAVAEYGLIAAVAGVAIAVASLALGSAVTSELAASNPPLALAACGQANGC